MSPPKSENRVLNISLSFLYNLKTVVEKRKTREIIVCRHSGFRPNSGRPIILPSKNALIIFSSWVLFMIVSSNFQSTGLSIKNHFFCFSAIGNQKRKISRSFLAFQYCYLDFIREV